MTSGQVALAPCLLSSQPLGEDLCYLGREAGQTATTDCTNLASTFFQ